MLEGTRVVSLEGSLGQALSGQPPSWTHLVSIVGRSIRFPRALLPEGRGRAVLASPDAFVPEEGRGAEVKGTGMA